MNPEQIELSKQLAALGLKDGKYFRWLPGASGWRGTHGAQTNIRFSTHFGRSNDRELPSVYVVDGDILRDCAGMEHDDGVHEHYPDFTDPATAGCLLMIWGELTPYSSGIFQYSKEACLGQELAKAILAIAKEDEKEKNDE